MPQHLPVMLEETIEVLDPTAGDRFVDSTLGLGGHAKALLERIGPGGRLIGLDRDPQMLAHASERLKGFGDAFRGVHARISSLAQVARGSGADPVDGILLDLGLCSAQLDDNERGFSFREEARKAPLDMRMDRSRGEPVAELLDRVNDDELAQLLRDGGAPWPRRIARALQAARPLRSIGNLLDAIATVNLPARRHHPATLIFQALRVAVNEELQDLETALESSADLLAPGGRLAVLSYHSGEDRRVKEFFAREVRGCICPPDLPVCGCGKSPRFRHLVRGQRASDSEITTNPRARSALLRAGARL